MKKENTTDLVVMDELTIDKIPLFLEKVDKAIKNFKVTDEDDSILRVELPFFGELKDVCDTKTLIEAYSSIKAREDSYKKSAKEMGIKNAPAFTMEGISAKKWKKAIINRENFISSSRKIEKLMKIREILVSRMSEEDKMKNDIQELQSILNEI